MNPKKQKPLPPNAKLTGRRQPVRLSGLLSGLTDERKHMPDVHQQNIEYLTPDYAGLYAALAALVCEARAHLDNCNNGACGESLDKAKAIVDAQSAPVLIAR